MEDYEAMLNAVKTRHSIRRYKDIPLKDEDRTKVENKIAKINAKSSLSFALVSGDKESFSSFLARYGSFKGVSSYIVLIGKKEKDLFFKCGYYGEELVLYLESIGISSCWTGLTYRSRKAKALVRDGEKLCLVIAIGYKDEEGRAHRSKKREDVMDAVNPPSWFLSGIDSALLAPTAINQQKFKFTLLEDNRVKATTKAGPFSHVDLGIACYHFMLAAGEKNFSFV